MLFSRWLLAPGGKSILAGFRTQSMQFLEWNWARRFRSATGYNGHPRINRGPPPGKKLAKALLENDPGLLLKASHDKQTYEQLRKRILGTLELPQPALLQHQYDDAQAYHKALASLVVEETLYTVVTNLASSFETATSTQINGISMQITGDRVCEGNYGKSITRDFFEAFTHSPLNRFDREGLRAGAVVFMLPKGADRKPENMVLGLIKVGSFKSSPLPRSMQTTQQANQGTKGTTKEAGKNTKKTNISRQKRALGDRLHFHAYEDEDTALQIGDDVDIFKVSSILNFQRQYTATRKPITNSNFNGLLYGSKVPEEDTYSEDSMGLQDGIMEEHVLEDDKDDEEGDTAPTFNIPLPMLNEAQNKALQDFITARDGSIRIVQGPPGTGKTTMTAAIVGKYIIDSRRLGMNRKLLICGPTNKSVVVLARKIINMCRGEKSIRIALAGDKSELLADNAKELEDDFVFSFIKLQAGLLQDLGKKLLKDGDIDHFTNSTHSFIHDLKKKIPGISLVNIEHVIEHVRNVYYGLDADSSEADIVNFEKKSKPNNDLKEALQRAVTMVKNLDEQQVVQVLLERAEVICCTLSSAGSMPLIRMGDVDDLIVDEASACTQAEILVPLRKKPRRMLLVGDPKQLPATVMSPHAISLGLSQSLQERLMFQDKIPYTLLDVQYRMSPKISEWPVSQFYNRAVADADVVKHPEYSGGKLILADDPFLWVQVAGEEQKDRNMSTRNEAEAEAVVSLLLREQKPQEHFHPDSFRIITFYKAQEAYLRLKLSQYNLDNVLVSTVDASQGCEADTVIVSFVRGTSGQIGFMKDVRRLNVAMTRAKYQLICVGNLYAIAGLEETGGNLIPKALAENILAKCIVLPTPDPLPPPPPKKPRSLSNSLKGENELGKKKKKKKQLLPSINTDTIS